MYPVNSTHAAFSPQVQRTINQSRLTAIEQQVPAIANAAHDLSRNVSRMIELVETRQPPSLKRELDGTPRPMDTKDLLASLNVARNALQELQAQCQSLDSEVGLLTRYQEDVHQEISQLVPLAVRANWYTRQVNKTVARAHNLGCQQAHVARSALDTIDQTRRLYQPRVRGIDRAILDNLETLGRL